MCCSFTEFLDIGFAERDDPHVDGNAGNKNGS